MTSLEDAVKLEEGTPEGVELSPKNEEPEVKVVEVSKDFSDTSETKLTNNETKFPMRELNVPFLGNDITFNPVASLIGLVPLWALAIYCMVEPDQARTTLRAWFDDVTDKFGWFYIVANPVLTFFTLWIAYRFGDIKLGPKDAEPEFSNASYFAMIFSAGVGVGLFFYGVSEPLWHREPDNYYSNAGYHSQNEIDQWAIIITMYHWGFAGWSPYITVALACGLASYRFGLPMTIRTTFYPVLGEYCWGWIGDTIDGYSIVMTVAGVCTSLGLGAMQIVSGLQDLGWIDPERENLEPVFVILIWVITLLATISVVSGLSVGIKILANTAFYLGCLICFLCFVMDQTKYLLNLLVQTTGMYLQYNYFQVPFWTDAFGTLHEGEGRAIDGNSSATWFIGAWTVFYMAWWVAWACFVGMFVARISKNRTLREVILSVFICPTMYSLIWFSFMGGIGLRHQRQALELQQIGEEAFQDKEYFVSDKSSFCYDVPQADVIVNDTVIFTNELPGVTPVCLLDTDNSNLAWFNVVNSYSYPDVNGFGGFGPFLSGLSIVTLAIYFVTSSDSGSLVVDILASNGATEHHWIQRVFWAVTEGAVACALLVAGKSDALSALQSASIVFGLPFNLFLFIMCMTIVEMCKTIEREQNQDQLDPSTLLPQEAQSWSMPLFGGIFNIFESIFSLFIFKTRQKATVKHVVEFFIALFLPFVSLYRIYTSALMDPKQKNKITSILTTVVYAIVFIGWIVLFSFGTVNYGFTALGWSALFTNAFILTALRMNFRSILGIRGNAVSDFIASSFLYPQVLSQMVIELQSENVSAYVAESHDE